MPTPRISNFALQLVGADANFSALAASSIDLFITDGNPLGSASNRALSDANVLALQAQGRIVAGYVDVAVTDDRRYYWRAEWTSNGSDTGAVTAAAPTWLKNGKIYSSGSTAAGYIVQYSDKDWQSIIINQVQDLVTRGYKAIFLDDVGRYYDFGTSTSTRATAADAMIDFVAAIRAAVPANVVLIANTSAYITNDNSGGITGARAQSYLNAIDFQLLENQPAATFNDARIDLPGEPLLILQSTPQHMLSDAEAWARGTLYIAPDESYNSFSATPYPTGAGADTITGGVGPNAINGMGGNDMLAGGPGDDTLTGGAGADSFVFGAAGEGADRITDFAIAEDRFDLGGGRFTAASPSGTGTLLTYSGGTVRIDGVTGLTLAQWNARVLAMASVPTIIAPAASAAGVPVVANVTLLFADPVTRGSGTITLSRADGSLVESFDAATSSRLTLAGGRLTIDPTRALDPGASYTLSIAAGAIVSGGTPVSAVSGYGFSTLAAATVDTNPDQFQLAVSARTAATVQGYGQVIGDSGTQDVTVLDRPGRIVFDGSFNQGGDRIRLSGNAADYTVVRAGSSVQVSDGDTIIAVPVGLGGADLIFGDGIRRLSFDTAAATLRIGAQAIGSTAAPITAAAQAATATGTLDASLVSQLVLFSGTKATAAGVEQVTGTTGAETVTVLAGATVSFDPSFNRGGDTIVLPFEANAYTAARSGSSVLLTSNTETLTIPLGPTATTLRFGDGDRALTFDTNLQAIKIGNQIIGAFTGNLTAAPTSAATIDRDSDGDLSTAFTIDASGANYRFTDDGTVAQNVRLTGFARGDRVTMTGSAADYLFSSSGSDITVSHIGSDGRLATTVFVGIADPSVYVNSEATAEVSAGFDFAAFTL